MTDEELYQMLYQGGTARRYSPEWLKEETERQWLEGPERGGGQLTPQDMDAIYKAMRQQDERRRARAMNEPQAGVGASGSYRNFIQGITPFTTGRPLAPDQLAPVRGGRIMTTDFPARAARIDPFPLPEPRPVGTPQPVTIPPPGFRASDIYAPRPPGYTAPPPSFNEPTRNYRNVPPNIGLRDRADQFYNDLVRRFGNRARAEGFVPMGRPVSPVFQAGVPGAGAAFGEGQTIYDQPEMQRFIDGLNQTSGPPNPYAAITTAASGAGAGAGALGGPAGATAAYLGEGTPSLPTMPEPGAPGGAPDYTSVFRNAPWNLTESAAPTGQEFMQNLNAGLPEQGGATPTGDAFSQLLGQYLSDTSGYLASTQRGPIPSINNAMPLPTGGATDTGGYFENPTVGSQGLRQSDIDQAAGVLAAETPFSEPTPIPGADTAAGQWDLYDANYDYGGGYTGDVAAGGAAPPAGAVDWSTGAPANPLDQILSAGPGPEVTLNQYQAPATEGGLVGGLATEGLEPGIPGITETPTDTGAESTAYYDATTGTYTGAPPEEPGLANIPPITFQTPGGPSDLPNMGQLYYDPVTKSWVSRAAGTVGNIARSIGRGAGAVGETIGHIPRMIGNLLSQPGYSSPEYLASIGYERGAGGAMWPGAAPDLGGPGNRNIGAYGATSGGYGAPPGGGSYFHGGGPFVGGAFWSPPGGIPLAGLGQGSWGNLGTFWDRLVMDAYRRGDPSMGFGPESAIGKYAAAFNQGVGRAAAPSWATIAPYFGGPAAATAAAARGFAGDIAAPAVGGGGVATRGDIRDVTRGIGGPGGRAMSAV